MEVVRITPRGYCHGVVEAIRMAKKVGTQSAGEPVAMLGYLVHNEHVTRELEDHGVRLVDSDDRVAGLEHIDSGTVIFTAHGVSPAVVDGARARGLRIVDATCSDVTRTHDLVRRLLEDGNEIVYIGKRGHPEPEGVVGIDPARIQLVERVEEVDGLDYPPGTRLAVTCQTTLSMWDTQAIIDRLVERYPDIDVHNEICLATQERQEAAVRAAADLDCVVVVGSTRSSNSRRLVQVVEERAGRRALLIDTAADLDPAWFRGVRRVGVTAGASTPTQITRAVIAALEALPDLE
jgi:4-hydroxy-3-methylbut-2-en-1-yl diphosphate reductase